MAKKIKSFPVAQRLASLKVTVICLLILTVLTVWGTIYQSSNGLYAAQQKFFHSWFSLMFGIIPIPGVALVLTVLFLNLVAALMVRIPYRWSNLGNILTHIGILILLVGGFLSFIGSEESILQLKEGESSRFSTAAHEWELAVWTEQGKIRNIFATDTSRISPGKSITFPPLNISLKIAYYYKNCRAFMDQAESTVKVKNESGITRLEERAQDEEPSKNVPGMVFTISSPPGINQTILLYGGESNATMVELNHQATYFSLRKKHFLLPIEIKLIDFEKKVYPGSEIAKSFESRIEIQTADFSRETVISMNNPLRFQDYTFFQSSYFSGHDGAEYSVLMVVKNKAKYIPYISSILVFLGLSIHFMLMLFRRRKHRIQQGFKNG